jgi:hypothetical protein
MRHHLKAERASNETMELTADSALRTIEPAMRHPIKAEAP